MSRLIATDLARDLAALFDGGTLADLTDGQLLDRFIVHRDDLSFEGLIARHGPMVHAICRRSLDDPRDIEDAFQATFLILVRKAPSLRDRGAVSSWLYGVALRVVRRARENARLRRSRERPLLAEPADHAPAGRAIIGEEVFEIVDEEIRRLPGNQQVAVIPLPAARPHSRGDRRRTRLAARDGQEPHRRRPPHAHPAPLPARSQPLRHRRDPPPSIRSRGHQHSPPPCPRGSPDWSRKPRS